MVELLGVPRMPPQEQFARVSKKLGDVRSFPLKGKG
jgi:hypothetical protein